MLKRALVFVLARLSTRSLAESMVGDLEGQTGVRPGSDQRQAGVRPTSDPGLTPVRFWRAALGLVLYFAGRRVLDAAHAAPSVLRASGLAGETRQALRALAR